MTTSKSPPKDGAKRPGQSSAGAKAAADRAERQAQQLRANLAKRKQQQRKRDSGETGGDVG